jgi:hypothetical protein
MAKRRNSADRLELKSPDPKQDAGAIYDLTAKCFSGAHNYYQWYRGADGYFGHSHYDWRGSTIGLLHGRVMTHWGIWGYDMRIGAARVRVAGIGAVATDGFHRKQGLMDVTARAGIEKTRQAGYDMSLLFGIGDYYHKFGYVRAWTPTTYSLAVDRLPEDPETPKPRREPFDPGAKDIRRMYNREHKHLTGTAVRPTYKAPIDWKKCDSWTWRDKAGRLKGYLVTSEARGKFNCLETGGKVETALAVLRKVAGKLGYRDVRLPSLHHDHPAAVWLRRNNCGIKRDYIRSGGPMIRTLSLRSTLEKLAPVLAARLGQSHLADWTGDLLIADGREKAVLQFGDDGCEVSDATRAASAIRGDDHVAQLLIGTDDPAEIVSAANMRLSGDARALLPILFPAQHPMLRQLDHF